MSKPPILAKEWHRRLLADGWLKRLSVVAKEIVIYALYQPYGRVVAIRTEQIRDALGRPKSTILKGIVELTAFGLVERLTGDLQKKARAHLKKTHNVSGDVLIAFVEPVHLSDVDKLILDDATCRRLLLKVLMSESITQTDFEHVAKRMTEVRQAGMSTDVLWSGVYTRLQNILKDKQDSPRRGLTLEQCLEYLRPKSEQELKLVPVTVENPSEEEKLGDREWASLNPHSRRVIESWERYTGRSFLKKEVEYVEEALRYCLPAQLIAGIRRHCENATSFEYLMPMIKRGAFGQRTQRTIGGERNVGTAGKAFSTSDWQAERERLQRKAQARRA